MKSTKLKTNDKSKYYQLNEILNKHCLYNFIIGHRGVGKTYALKCYCIRRFLKHDEQFVWVRRYKSELKEAKENFMTDLLKNNVFPNNSIKVDGLKLMIDGKVAGYFVNLSTSSKQKSKPFPNVFTIVFDEFLITKSTYKYLQEESTIFDELFNTIDRYEDRTTAFFVGNAISFVNPYFIEYKIRQTNNRFTFDKTGLAVVENYKNELFIEHAKKSRFGRLKAGSEYEKYAIENDFLEDDNKFIAEKPKNCRFFCTYVFENQKIGFWIDRETGNIHASAKYDPSSTQMFSILSQDHAPNMVMLKHLKNSYSRDLKLAYQFGQLYFESQLIKKTFEKMLTYLL